MGQILRNPKDQKPRQFRRNIQNILFLQVYIGETGKMVNLRIKEHQHDVRLKHTTQLALSEYNRNRTNIV